MHTTKINILLLKCSKHVTILFIIPPLVVLHLNVLPVLDISVFAVNSSSVDSTENYYVHNILIFVGSLELFKGKV